MPKIPTVRVPATKRVIYQGPEDYIVIFFDQSGQRFEELDFHESDFDRATLVANYMINNSTTKRPKLRDLESAK